MDYSEYQKLPPKLRESLESTGYYPGYLDTKEKIPGKEPYTRAGATRLRGEAVANMDPGHGASTIRTPDTGETFIVHNRNATRDPSNTRAHEMEHALAAQGVGSGSKLNKMWDELVGKDAPVHSTRGFIVQRLVEHAPYLQEKWGLPAEDVKAGYFSPGVLKRPDSHNFLYEQMATLSGLEQAMNKRLTDDPYVRDNILRTPDERETYNALTGLRQSRLDPRDLPPYTRQPDKSDPTLVQRLKSLLGFAEGGYVPNAGNNKLI